MDNIAHTLAGIALAEAGLKRRTALGTATLAIGANLPDVDAFAQIFVSSTESLVIRRGWTHGILAMVVLPLVLALAVAGWDRAVRQRRLRRGGRSRDPARFGGLLLLAAIGVWSHPLLDLFNTYGVRLLMPFSDRWFYGDTLFIVDPWLWLSLGAGIWLSRRRARGSSDAGPAARANAARPARVAIALLAAYVVVMAASSWWGRRIVAAHEPRGDRRTLVSPAPVNPFRRGVVRDLGDRYEVGELSFAGPPRYRATGGMAIGAELPGVPAASRTRDGANFLYWARFPRFESTPAGDSLRVRMSDARYSDAMGRGWASVVITVPAR